MKELVDEESGAAHNYISKDHGRTFYEKKELPVFLSSFVWRVYSSFIKQKDPCL